jgi:phosphatidylglycerophosphatase GEP4
MRPDLALKKFSSLRQSILANPKEWSQVKCLIFDKDNCLTLPHSNSLHSGFEEDWQWLKENFRVAVLSNSAGSFFFDPRYSKADSLSASLGVPVLRHFVNKPFCLSALSRFTKGEKAAVVGDRILTDVLLAKLSGYKSILIRPIDESLDSIWVRMARRAEILLFERQS